MARTSERAAHFVAVVADVDAPAPATRDRLRPTQEALLMEGLPMVERSRRAPMTEQIFPCTRRPRPWGSMRLTRAAALPRWPFRSMMIFPNCTSSWLMQAWARVAKWKS
jgi:hypothetical protein